MFEISYFEWLQPSVSQNASVLGVQFYVPMDTSMTNDVLWNGLRNEKHLH